MNNDIIIFENQEVNLDVNIKDDTVWLTNNQMAKLFLRDEKTIRKHINNIFHYSFLYPPIFIISRNRKKLMSFKCKFS